MSQLTVAEYPGALWVPADSSNYSPDHRNLSSILHVVVHITDGHADAHGPAEMFATPKWKRSPPVASSAHFIVGQDALVIQCIPLNAIAWHAHDANATSIALEHSARSPGEFSRTDAGLFVSDVQYAGSARLAAWCCWRCGLPATRDVIRGHVEIDPKTTHADCPNRIWDWPRYMALVTAEYAKLSAIG